MEPRWVEFATDVVDADPNLDPAYLVAPTGSLDALIVNLVHYPMFFGLTAEQCKYGTTADERNCCMKLIARVSSGFHDPLTCDVFPYRYQRELGHASETPGYMDLVSKRVLQVWDDFIEWLLDNAKAKV